jgi:hypothetical protein
VQSYAIISIYANISAIIFAKSDIYPYQRAKTALLQVQCVPHAVLFGLQITQVVLVWRDFDGHVLDNLQTVCL